MGIPEIIAIGYFVVWGVERIFSWKHKRTRSRQIKQVVTLTETIIAKNGFTSDPTIPKQP